MQGKYKNSLCGTFLYPLKLWRKRGGEKCYPFVSFSGIDSPPQSNEFSVTQYRNATKALSSFDNRVISRWLYRGRIALLMRARSLKKDFFMWTKLA